ncbi:HNH endonuclease signature motif containing protein [Microbacterium sp. H1-D42]|uniref:HNH endonuclease signature motif containing protein n=1 Tax=Microbacterium sp. H1-D42 TaxID=2925844 RepID=UPI001F538042|nr:HNH endonuclease signature motif containing protein [Microbacterium sp. H1-D42]UNK71523.1 HNH endonuclease [Microbacterium sp. H1-D42]
MSDHLSALHEAMDRLDAVWADAGDAAGLPRPRLVSTNAAIGLMRRQLDALQAEVAAEIAHESRPELGADSLAKQHGFRNTAQLIASTTGSSAGDAARLVKVGEAIAPRTNLVGEPVPAKYPAVRRAVCAGQMSTSAAGLIIALLDRSRLKVGADRIAEAEELLAAKAVGFSLDDVRKLLARAEAFLDPDGIEMREDERRSRRSATMFERDGMFHLNLVTTVEAGAPIKASVQGHVSAVFGARKGAIAPDGLDADQRTVPMLQADALTALCEHAVGCSTDRVPLNGATVVVRVNLDDLTDGSGYGTIDGVDEPISISAVRRMAASGAVIPCVLGGDSEILDWGREKRLFTPAQRLALGERDGGCAMCGLPPGMAKAHHIRWWMRDSGPTDLDNGVLLCDNCHHRIHDSGWEINIEGAGVSAQVWFVPPPFVDPLRTPRLGGRARYDIAA